MLDYLKSILRQLSATESNTDDEVERIAFLQQTAVRRRAEYHEKKEQATRNDDTQNIDSLSFYRKRMEEAEKAHMVALQKWENKQSKQKSH